MCDIESDSYSLQVCIYDLVSFYLDRCKISFLWECNESFLPLEGSVDVYLTFI